MRTAWLTGFAAGITTKRSTSLSVRGVPYAKEPKRMILSGLNLSAICLA